MCLRGSGGFEKGAGECASWEGIPGPELCSVTWTAAFFCGGSFAIAVVLSRAFSGRVSRSLPRLDNFGRTPLTRPEELARVGMDVSREKLFLPWSPMAST